MKSENLADMTVEELRAEREVWDKKIESATSWGARLTAAAEFRDACDAELRRRFIDLTVSQRAPHATDLVKGLGGSYHADEQMGVYHIVGVRDEESIYLLERSRLVGEEHKYYASEEDYEARRALNVARIKQQATGG